MVARGSRGNIPVHLTARGHVTLLRNRQLASYNHESTREAANCLSYHVQLVNTERHWISHEDRPSWRQPLIQFFIKNFLIKTNTRITVDMCAQNL